MTDIIADHVKQLLLKKDKCIIFYVYFTHVHILHPPQPRQFL
jgi:hypothetical protein